MKICDFIKGGGKMFPLLKSIEVRQVPEGKTGEKRRLSNSHLTLKVEAGWERWEVTTACNSLEKMFCWKNNPPCFCQTYHNSCTFKSVKLPASIQVSKHWLLLEHLKNPHKLLLLTSKAVSCNKMPSDTSASFLTCQNKTFRWPRLYCKQLSSLCPLGEADALKSVGNWIFCHSRASAVNISLSAHGCPWEQHLHLRRFLILPAKIQTGQVSVVVSRRMPL